MKPLKREDLFTLETYSEARSAFREKVMAHKANRRVELGDHLVLYFEDQLTIQYQVQEMLRVEKIFETAGIAEELEAYNPLIPDGENLKATFMIEFESVDQRRTALEQMRGIEDRIWMQVDGHEPVYAIADEDLDRSSDEKTAAVHFLRFELGTGAADFRAGAALSVGVDHPAYTHRVEALNPPTRDALAADLDPV